jgi:SAM-dependent methyltransferase
MTRETLIRIAAPIEDVRFIELPELIAALSAEPGERILDLASPKLAAVELARRGAHVVSVDQSRPEVDEWRQLTRGSDRLQFDVADGRSLAFEDESFDHAYSISVIEHIGDDGDFAAFAELARVVKPGGRVVVSFPYDLRGREDWRERPVYEGGTAEQSGRYFFQRRYDPERVERLLAAAPQLVVRVRRELRFSESRFYRFYSRRAPWTLPLGPLLAWLVRPVEAPGGFLFMVLERRGDQSTAKAT